MPVSISLHLLRFLLLLKDLFVLLDLLLELIQVSNQRFIGLIRVNHLFEDMTNNTLNTRLVLFGELYGE
jgi:hypothetical protein